MFQEREIIYSTPEKPADVSKDRLFIPFSENQLMFQKIDYIISFFRKTS